ncbi:MAG: DUF3048 domain-containing protein [Anaerolineae bacterium]|nr:DUF3048 domain-containing protein [Anaerolineae bacterium]
MRRLVLALVVFGSMFLAGFVMVLARSVYTRPAQNGAATPTPFPTWEPTPSGALGPFDFQPQINPLTGLQVSDPNVLKRRPLAVKISNAPALVRPQAGISEADLVFEHLTEGKLTRFTAVFWTHTPPRVGSVRSARLIDLEIATMYNALFAFSGASTGVRDKIFKSSFADRAFEGVTVGPPVFYRDDGIEVPHNMFASPDALWKRADAKGVDSPPAKLGGMVFSPTPQPKGEPGTTITVDYGPTTAEWRYDVQAGRYARWSDGKPHTDANNKAQITAANVVILYAWHQYDYNIVESEFQGSKSYSIEIQLWTLGPALVCRDGQCVRGLWNRWNKADMLSFWTEAHQPIYLKPGNTWFQVVNLPDAPDIQQTITVK